MNPPSFKHRLLTAALATAAGLGVLFLRGHPGVWVEKFDHACVRAAAGDGLVFDTGADNTTITASKLAPRPDAARPVQLVNVTDDPRRIFEHPNLETASLSSRLALFQSTAIALPVTRGATAQPMPAPLARATISYAQAKGSISTLPLVNQVPLPPHTSGGDHTLAGFHTIESTPAAPGRIPMLAHWQGKGLVPSIDLLTLMALHGTIPQDLKIIPGKHIRLGLGGPVIPLDAYGQTPTATPSPPSFPPLIAAELAGTPPPANPAPLANPNTVCLIRATGEKTHTTSIIPPERINAILTLAQTAPVPTDPRKYRPLPLPATAAIILAVALLAFWLTGIHGSNRHLAFALLATLHFPLLSALMDITGHWFSLTAPLTTLLTTWLIPAKPSFGASNSKLNTQN